MAVRVKIEDKTKDIVTYHDYPVEKIKFKRPPKEAEEDNSDELKEITEEK